MNAMTERLVAHAVAQGQARANRERKRQCVYLDMADVATRAYVRPFDEPTPHGCRFVTHKTRSSKDTTTFPTTLAPDRDSTRFSS